jgi:anaerobic magnesium-protoporphyrin IX monomethyl ester cyclase
MKHFPESEPIAMCLGISYMNLGKYEDALECFQKFHESRDTLQYIADCYRALGNAEKEKSVLKRLERLNTQA